ncbi:hypothetical protein JCM9492_07070 [Aquifex pyrophilus]
MELRRVEGILLEQAILSGKPQETTKTSRRIEIKLLGRVPEVLKNLLLSSRTLKAKVLRNDRGKILLLLENGYEIEAENNLRIPVKEGETLTLILEKLNPLTLRVLRSSFKKDVSLKLIGGLLYKLNGYHPEEILKFSSFKNSGLFYESKLVKALISGEFEEVKKDLKFKALKEERKDLIKFIELLQRYIVENKYEKLLIPVKWKERRAFLLFRVSEGYKISIHLPLENGFLNVFLSAPKSLSFFSMKIESNNEEIIKEIRNSLKEINEILGKPIKSLEFKLTEENNFIKELSDGINIEVKV